MSIRRRRRNKGRQQAGGVVERAAPPRVRQGPVEIPGDTVGPTAGNALQSSAVTQGPDYAYVKRDMIWLLSVSVVLFVAMVIIAPFL